MALIISSMLGSSLCGYGVCSFGGGYLFCRKDSFFSLSVLRSSLSCLAC